MPVEQAGNSQPEVDTTFEDAKAAYAEVTQGPATEPELPLSESKETTEPKTEAKPEETKTDDRPRDEFGRFTEKTDEKPAEAKPQKAAPQEQPKAPQAPPPAEAKVEASAAPPVGPPPGWSVKSKSEWDKLPEHIRADVVKRETEVSQGFAQYSGMKELQPYVEMARQGGTTLKAALDNYVGIERLLRQDPFRAITQIANNIGIRPEQLVTGLSLHLGVGQSNGHAQVPEGQSTGLPPEVLQQYFNPLHQEVSQLKQLLTSQQQEAEARATSALNSTLSRFQADPSHRYYENVRTKMAQLIKAEVVPATGDDMADLKAAYELACWQDPEIRSLLIKDQSAKSEADRKQKEKDAADKARQASKSITGSPSSTVTEGRDRSGDSVEDAARDAYRSVMSSSRV